MKLLLAFIIALFFPLCILAQQPGANDFTFNTLDDGTYGDGSGFNDHVSATVVQPDGKIIAGGHFTAYNGVPMTRIARLNADGSLDPTFNPGTGFNWKVYTISLQPDGKIVVGGEFYAFNGISRKSIARLNTDGSLDLTFHPVGGSVNCCGLNWEVLTMEIQPDGKIIAGGAFTSFGNIYQGRIIRFNSNGSLDPTFNIGSGFNDWVHEVALQPDGKVVVTGAFTSFNGTTRNRIARLNADGSLDLSFDPGSGFNNLGSVGALTLQPDGKILAGGGFSHFNGIPRNKIARLNSDGSLDTSFNPGVGFNASGSVITIDLQTDGKMLVSGIFFAYNGTTPRYLLRLNTDASVDPSFVTGTSFNGTIYETVRQPDGKFVCVGDFTSYTGISRPRIARLDANGGLDGAFNPGSGANKLISSTSIQADGKIIAGGNFTFFNGVAKNRIARLDSDGSLDPAFNPGTGFDAEVLTTGVQTDGKILVAGRFTTFNGTTRNRIVRLNSDGSLDAGFTIGTGFNAPVRFVIQQSDGKIIVGGEFTTYNGTTRNRIVRLNADGTLDPTFTPGSGFNNAVSSIAIQPDGKILVAGDFSSFNGNAINRAVRLNTNGTIDASFTPGSGFNLEVKAVAIQTDGKILFGGVFTTFNGAAINRIARLNPDGSSDPLFNPGTGVNDSVWSIAVQTDGLILIGGNFTSFNGTTRNRIARLNPNGSLNTLFNPGTGFTDKVKSLSLQADGKVIAAGDYTSFNALFKTRIARLLTACPVITSTAVVTDVSCTNGSNGTINLTPSGGTVPYSFVWNDGVITEDRSGLSDGTYSVTVTDAVGCSINYNVTVTEPLASFSVGVSTSNVSCFAGSNGAIDLTVTGGVLPYTFDWGSGVASEDRSSLSAGTYSVTIADANGCLVTNATVTQPAAPLSASVISSNVTCFGDANGTIDLSPAGGTTPYTFNWGSGVTTEDRTGLAVGNYSVAITDFNGCSITLSTAITQAGPITSAFSATACGTYSWNAQTYNTSGIYQQVFTAANGCDSTVTLNLTINQASSGTITQTACNSFTLNGQTYTTSGTYTQYLTNTAGCDSTLTLNLSINNATSNSMTQTACDSYTLNGQTYTSSGTYTQNLTNAAGCDSLLTLILTINYSTSGFVNQTACNSYTLNGQTYTSSGVYTQQFTNAAGCDSTLTLDLTINHDASATITQIACETVTLNGQTYTSSGTYIQNLTTSTGCDSTLTLNLTVTNPSSASITETACGSFTLNGQTYTSSGMYTQNLTNAAGCDSTLTLNLTVLASAVSTAADNGDGSITASSNNSYQWINCSTGATIAGATTQTFTALTDGAYAVIGTSANGCSDTSNCVAIDYLGIKEEPAFEVSFVPNPTDDKVVILFSGTASNLIIRDFQGKIMSSQKIVSGEHVSLKQFADGVYLFELSSQEGKVISRVVKN